MHRRSPRRHGRVTAFRRQSCALFLSWGVLPVTVGGVSGAHFSGDAEQCMCHRPNDLEAGKDRRELDDLATAEDLDAQVLALVDVLELPEDCGAIGGAGHGHALDLEQDIAPDDDMLTFHDADAVASLEPELIGHRTLGHLL